MAHALLELVQGGGGLLQFGAVAQALQHGGEGGGVHAVPAASRQLHMPSELQQGERMRRM